MPATKPFRAITFTSFEADPPDWNQLKGHLRYLAYGQEECPTTKKQHWQGFAYSFTRPAQPQAGTTLGGSRARRGGVYLTAYIYQSVLESQLPHKIEN